ncbi:MAG: hypothetical protein J0I06_09850 [Planctomycetes bacterium]|nr:hypothetical protein [Planctomycetota bacterium]
MYPPKWTLRAIVAAGAILAVAVPRAGAQPNPNPNPNPFRTPPGLGPLFPGQSRPPTVFLPPAFNVPGIPFNPDPFFANPRLNPVQFVPVNTAAPNPFFVNPFLVNPFNNPFADKNPFNNPLNPLANSNPFSPNPFGPNPFANPFAPVVVSTPAVALQQPGFLQWRGPDLQVNPFSGTVVKPFTGVARTADGSLFYQLSPTGAPITFTGGPRTGIYYDPVHGTYLNPITGVIVRPGGTSVFVPR